MCPANFTQHNVVQIHPCCHKWQDFLRFEEHVGLVTSRYTPPVAPFGSMRSEALSEGAPSFLASTSPYPLHSTHQQPCPSFWFSREPACLQVFADALPSAQNIPSPIPFAWLTHTDSSLSPPSLCLVRKVPFACTSIPSVTTLSYQ